MCHLRWGPTSDTIGNMIDAYRAAKARAMWVAICRRYSPRLVVKSKKRLSEAMALMPWTEEQLTDWEYAKLEA